MSTWQNNTSIEGRVGIKVETTEGTAETEPSIELFVNEGNAPELNQIVDNKVDNKPYNEPYKRGATKGYWHTEGAINGMKFSPTNGVPEFLTVGFGNSWYSNQVYTITLEAAGGLLFKRGDKIFGKTSLARAEVVRVVGDVLWLTGVQGTFAAGGNEDLLNSNLAAAVDWTTDTLVTTPAFGAVAGYYCHKMDAVRNFDNCGTIKANTVALNACLGDTMTDFSEFGQSTGKKKVFVTVKDTTAGTPIPISGWMGAPCMMVAFKTGSKTFTVGKKLSAKTGSGAVTVIGDIIGFTVASGTWAADAAGYLFVTQDATARAVLNADVLSDDGTTPAVAVADQALIPAYLNNGVKIYNNADTSGAVQSWNGNITTFDETDVLTYNAVQKTFDQKSLSVFVKDAGDNTKVGYGTKVKEISFDIAVDNFNYNVNLLGRNLKYPTIEPAYPGGLTDSAPFGAESRTFEIDGVSTGQAAQVNKAKFSATWDFAPGKGVVISENYPTNLQPTKYGIVGTLDVQWKDNSLMKAFWNNPSGNEPLGGELITKRLCFVMNSGEEVVAGGYDKILSIEVLGTIDSVTLNRDQDGYIQPITIEGVMLDDTWSFGPARFYVFDATATHT